MLQSLQIPLETNEHEKQLLLETMKRYNLAANFIAEKAFESKFANKYDLQKLYHREIRQPFNLSSQFAIRVISKVVEAYKRDKSSKPTFRTNGAIQYDQRNLSRKGIDRVSIITLNGRIKLAMRIGEYQRARANALRGQADLIYRRGNFHLIAAVDMQEQSQYEPKGTFGIKSLATDSDGQVFSVKQVEKTRQRYSRLRSTLQSVGTMSAKRKLKQVSGRERRFKKDTNHVVSKQIVSKAKGTTRALVLENLKDIRSRATVRHEQRERHSKWAFGELRQFVEYKAKRGVHLVFVNPKNISSECPECHYVDKRNRPTRDTFRCVRCGLEAMADYVAAKNIASRARFNEPIVAPLRSAVTISLLQAGEVERILRQR